MARRISLIVNPRAGGGRAAAALPLVEAALSAREAAWHVEATRSLEHARELARTPRDAGGTLVYAYAALRALAAWTPARFELELDGCRRLAFPGFSVGACNTRAYGGGMFVAPEAEIDDGLLDVVMYSRGTKRRFLYNLTKT